MPTQGLGTGPLGFMPLGGGEAVIATPEGLCVTATVNALCLRLNWGPVPGISSYRLYRSPEPHDGFCQIAHGLVGLTYYDDPQNPRNLNLYNLFYYKVVAEDISGQATLSPPSTFSPYGEITHHNVPVPGRCWNTYIRQGLAPSNTTAPTPSATWQSLIGGQ